MHVMARALVVVLAIPSCKPNPAFDEPLATTTTTSAASGGHGTGESTAVEPATGSPQASTGDGACAPDDDEAEASAQVLGPAPTTPPRLESAPQTVGGLDEEDWFQFTLTQPPMSQTTLRPAAATDAATLEVCLFPVCDDPPASIDQCSAITLDEVLSPSGVLGCCDPQEAFTNTACVTSLTAFVRVRPLEGVEVCTEYRLCYGHGLSGDCG